METTRIQVSNNDISRWLEAYSRKVTPSGQSLYGNLTIVAEGEIVEFTTSGGQTFGSGGYSAGCRYAGNEPEFVEPAEGRHTSFISDSAARFRFNAPCVVHTYGGDAIGRNGRSWFHLYVCATDEQIAEAVQVMAERRALETETGDLELLQSKLQSWFNIGLRHKHGPGGVCYGGFDGCPDEISWTRTVYTVLNEGVVDETAIALFEKSIRAAIRKAALGGTPEARLAEYNAALKAAQAVIEAEDKASRRAFAQGVADQFVSAGFSRNAAWTIMKAAGPGRALDALNWAVQWVNTIAPRSESRSATAYGLMLFLKGLVAEAKGQRDIHWALEGMGLESPQVKATHLWAIVNGAVSAYEVGIPEAVFTGELVQLPRNLISRD